MESRSPRVSVALCTHNGARFLLPQLTSLAAQNRLPDELVVCDDDSQDGTVAMVERFAAEAPFPVRVFRNSPALGVTANFSRAFELCVGDLIFPCDQDDVWHPDKIAVLAGALASDATAALAFCDLQIVDGNGRPSGRTQWQALGLDARMHALLAGPRPWEQLLRFNVVTGAAMAFPAWLLRHVLPIPGAWVHDEWIASLASVLGKVLPVAAPLVHYRRHEAQLIGAAQSGLLGQLAHARTRMNQRYFEGLLERGLVLQQRFTGLASRIDPAAMNALQARIEHLRTRVDLRANAWRRLSSVAREWQKGSYHRFGYGWKSAAQDLFL